MWETVNTFVDDYGEEIALGTVMFIGLVIAFQLLLAGIRYFRGKGKPMPVKTLSAWRSRIRFQRKPGITQAEQDLICDLITDKFEDAIHEGRLTRDQAEYWYRALGVGGPLPGLIPMSARKRQEFLYQMNGDAVTPQQAGWLKRIITFRRANGLHATDPADLPVEAKAPEKVVDKVKRTPKGKGFKALNAAS